MSSVWDYSKTELERSEKGKILILERSINYGLEKGEKLKRKDIIKYWDQLTLFPKKKRLLELLIWNKIQSSA